MASKHTPESRRLISEARKGKPRSDETKQRIREAMLAHWAIVKRLEEEGMKDQDQKWSAEEIARNPPSHPGAGKLHYDAEGRLVTRRQRRRDAKEARRAAKAGKDD